MHRFARSVLAALLPSLGIAGPCAAQDPPPAIKLSIGTEAAAKAIGAKPAGGTNAILVDVASLGVDGTATILSAIDDLRRAGGTAFAVCPNSAAGIKDGAAVVALACDALLFVKSAELTGADDGWCTSASRRDDIARKLTALGRIDSLLADRFTTSTKALSWSAKAGFTADDSGSVKLASAGKPIACGAAQLTRVRVAATEYDSVDSALKAIADGKIKPRTSAPALPAGGSGLPSAPRNPTVPPTVTPPPSAPNAPPSPASPSATDPKLAPKLAEYATTLGELKTLLDEFDDYYVGRRGVWTSEHRGLKWVWEDGSEHTRDPDTKVTCQRLQRDIKTKIGALDSLSKVVERIAKDREHPEVVRMKAHKVALDGLKIGIDRNKVSNYETYFKQVMALK